MKKTLFILIGLLAAMLVLSCASSAPAPAPAPVTYQGSGTDSRVPQFVRDAVRNTPEDALVGVGTARMQNINQSRTISSTRARAELSRQMDTIIRDMVRDYSAGSEVDHSAALSFQENITVALSQSRLQGANIVDEDMDADGNYWTVVMLNKTGVVNEINQAVSAAKLRVPAMASFDAEARMNAAFDRYFGAPADITYSDRD